MSNTEYHRGGRKEVLTLELARKIIKLIERMPDASIPISWASIELHIKRQFGMKLLRNVLSQKEWEGRKLIAEAYSVAKEVQRRLLKQEAPKYANSPRGELRKRIATLEATVLALKQELAKARSEQYTQLDLFRVTRMDLRHMAEDAQQGKEA